MIRRLVLAFLLLPGSAWACAVCFSGEDRGRAAFLGTTILLSLFPLGMIAGGLVWLRRSAPGLFSQDFGGDSDASSSPGSGAPHPAPPGETP